MAQWNGQFTGHTHATKVADRVDSLRAAIARHCEAVTVDETLPDVATLAGRVIEARRQSMKARLSRLCEPSAKPPPHSQIERLERQLRELESGGVAGILQEFRCPQHIIDGIPDAS